MKNEIEIYVIAYNNLFCVEYQIKSFRAFCKDEYKLIIIDSNCGEHIQNSMDKKKICEEYGVELISLPNFLSNQSLNPSDILAKKLNYTYYNIVRERKPRYFCFIDQDFFPFSNFSVKETLDTHGMYGDIAEIDTSEFRSGSNERPWMLHPWLSFYRYDFINDFSMDWSACPGFDTGGKNWYNLISKLGIEKKNYWRRDNIIMHFPWKDISNSGPHGHENEYFRWGEKVIYGQVQIYDDKFVHMLNSKYLDDPMNPKTNWCKGFLDACILKERGINSDISE